MEQEHGRMEVGEDLRNEIRRGVRITLASFRYDAQKKTKQQARSHVIFFPYLSSKLSHRFSSTPTSHLCSELSVFQPQPPVARGKEWTCYVSLRSFTKVSPPTFAPLSQSPFCNNRGMSLRCWCLAENEGTNEGFETPSTRDIGLIHNKFRPNLSLSRWSLLF